MSFGIFDTVSLRRLWQQTWCRCDVALWFDHRFDRGLHFVEDLNPIEHSLERGLQSTCSALFSICLSKVMADLTSDVGYLAFDGNRSCFDGNRS